MASARRLATLPPMTLGLRRCEVTVMGSGGGGVASGMALEMIDVMTGCAVLSMLLVALAVPVTEVERVVFGPEVADGEGTSSKPLRPQLTLRPAPLKVAGL